MRAVVVVDGVAITLALRLSISVRVTCQPHDCVEKRVEGRTEIERLVVEAPRELLLLPHHSPLVELLFRPGLAASQQQLL